MRNTNKKGFTIVELVIVVAVIAILAAVLIPTFSGIIRKANISSDTVVAKNLNTAAIAAGAEDFNAAIEAIKEAGYLVANLNAKANGCYFVWEDDSNQFLLYDLENAKVIYSNTDNYGAIDASWCFAISNSTVATEVKTALPNITVKTTIANVDDLKEAIAVGGEIWLDESVSVAESHIFGKEGVVTIVNLGSSRVNTDGVLDNAVPVIVDNKGEVTFNGGVITGVGTFVETDGDVVTGSFWTEAGTTTTLNGTIFGASDGIGKVVFAGNATLNNVEVTSTNIGIDITDKAKVELNDTKITVNGGRGICLYICDGHSGTERSKVTINSGVYSGKGNGALISLCGGDAEVNGGTFNGSGKIFGFGWFVESTKDSVITVTGGTFNGKTFEQLCTGSESEILANWQALCDSNCAVSVSNGVVTITAK